MADWIPTEAESLVPEGSALPYEADGLSVLLIRHEGCIHAIENRCSHDGSDMTGGHLEGAQWVCPHHGAKFDVSSGEARCAPAYEPVKTFPVKIENGVVFVEDDRW
jgi:3-phenylpropionate/trans-cinnamate dioxygenase ferredoxin subunit